MNSSFLICCYPRSRSQWLSHFLTLPGESVCHHEGTEHAGSASEFWGNAEHLSGAFGADIYGNADSANIFVLPALLAERPLTRVVWISRDIVEVAKSMKRAGIPCEEKALRNLMAMREIYRELCDLEIDFYNLRFDMVCKELWDFCLPGVPFDSQRWKRFDRQKICYTKQNPMPQKDYQKFVAWAQREIDEIQTITT